jgi:hypothetical protein
MYFLNTALIRTEHISPPHGSHQAFSTTFLPQEWGKKHAIFMKQWQEHKPCSVIFDYLKQERFVGMSSLYRSVCLFVFGARVPRGPGHPHSRGF